MGFFRERDKRIKICGKSQSLSKICGKSIFPNKRQCVFKATHRGRIKHLQVIFVIVSVL